MITPKTMCNSIMLLEHNSPDVIENEITKLIETHPKTAEWWEQVGLLLENENYHTESGIVDRLLKGIR